MSIVKLHRRAFLQQAAAAGLGVRQRPDFRTANSRWQAAYDRALAVLAGNVQVLPRYGKPVLIEGADYAGIWMECGPHEALVYRKFRPDIARNRTVARQQQSIGDRLRANSDGRSHRGNRLGACPVNRRR